MDNVTMRVALESMMRATEDDATPIIRRLARTQARAALDASVEGLTSGEGKTHHIKCWPDVFEEMRAGRKTAEFRYNDRGYAVGDMLLIREWDTTTAAYTHREITRQITHVLDGGFGMPSGYAMLSLASPKATATASVREDRPGWIVCNNAGQWRTFDSFGWAWTDRRDLAVRYARRSDAELVHGEDEDSWRVEFYPATLTDSGTAATIGGERA